MAADEGVILTAEQIAQWKNQKAELEGQMAHIQHELVTIIRRLELLRAQLHDYR